jgi:GH43 family beta-xylosidase
VKKAVGIWGIAALSLVIGFTMAVCDDGGTALAGSVVIPDTISVGDVIKPNIDRLNGSGTPSYQWQLGETETGPFTNITAANGETYTPVAEDKNLFIRVAVSREGYTGSVPSNAVLVQAEKRYFTNPLATQATPDPFAVYWEGYYYSVEAAGSNQISVGIRKVQKLQDVFRATREVVYTSTHAYYQCSHWAPELHRFNGKWYIYTCSLPIGAPNADRRVVVLEGGEKPDDPFVFKAHLDTGEFYSLDASPFIAPNGKMYLMWSGGVATGQEGPCYLYMAEMENPYTMKNPGERREISKIDYAWEINANEGPSILVKNGKLNVVYSANDFTSAAYCLGLLTCTNANDPDYTKWTWEKNPVQFLSYADGLLGPGHNSFTVSPDGKEDWIVFHVKTSPAAGSNRVACAQRIIWEDDSPVVVRPVTLNTQILEPSGTP